MTEYLDEIQARADAATEGPWLVVHEPEREEGNYTIPDVIYVASSDLPDGFEVCRVSTDHEDDPVDVLADAAFIAHARTDVPRLVAALRAVEALHTYDGQDVCPVCTDDMLEPLPSPCPTVTAIRDALGEA